MTDLRRATRALGAPVRLLPRFAQCKSHVLVHGGRLTQFAPLSGSASPAREGKLRGPGWRFTAASSHCLAETAAWSGYPTAFVCVVRFSDVTTNAVIATMGDTNTNSCRFQIDVNAGSLRGIVVADGVTVDTRSVSVSTNTWYSIVYAAASSTDRRLYLNGSLVSSSTGSYPISDTFETAVFGCTVNAIYPLGNAFISMEMAIGAWLNIKLEDPLAALLSTNPWGLFRQPRRRGVYGEAAVGGASNAPRYYHRTMHGMS